MLLLYMLSNSSKYALKAVLYLSLYSDDNNKLFVKDISENTDIPRAYTAKLLQELARRNLISSTRGPKGGFYVSEENRQQCVMSIVDAIDGKSKMETCMLGLEDCDESKPCPLHHLIVSSRTALIQVLETKTIQDLATELEHKRAFMPK
ncbi:MAG: RrF2 family transcriptional regulator [Flavobacteriaceae bacterium]